VLRNFNGEIITWEITVRASHIPFNWLLLYGRVIRGAVVSELLENFRSKGQQSWRERKRETVVDDKGGREENLASLYRVGWGRIKAEGRQWHARLLAATTRRQHSTLTRISAACNINIHAR
jgi:hypothetical protein